MTTQHGLKVGDTVRVTPAPGADECIALFPSVWVVVEVDPDSAWLREPGGGFEKSVRIDFPKRSK